MAEEIKINESGEQVDNTDYVAAINELKQNSVSKDKYDKLKEENKKLLDAIVTGDSSEVATKDKPKPDIAQLRKELYSEDSDFNNLHFVQKALELRKAIIDEGGNDPFLPNGKNIKPTDEDIEKAENCARVYQECIDYAEGDSELFTNELMRRTVDSAPMALKKKNKR